MEININLSAKMTAEKQKLLEDRVIRIPKRYREKLGITVGEFLSLRAKNGEFITLQVEVAYKKDSKANEYFAYVTDTIYSTLNLINNKEDVKIVDEITLGTDPEFFIIDRQNKGNIIGANYWFDKWGEIGFDALLAEIRPAPSTNVNILVNNIRTLLNRVQQTINAEGTFNTDLYASSHYRGICAGFHLHYGIPKQLLGNHSTNKVILNTIVRVLDYYVTLPCVVVEGMKESGRRCAPFISYGKIGDYRVDHRTLEYRVPGASLLKHPVLTEGLIALGATVIEDVISRARVLTDDFQNKTLLGYENLQKLYPGIPDMNTLYNAVSVPDDTNARYYFERIKSDVKNMVGYSKRISAIENFFVNVDTPFTNSIVKNWQLNNMIMSA